MKISKNTVVTVQYVLRDAQNNVIEEDSDPIVYLHGGYENTLPAIEKALEGQETGFSVEIQVEPEDAFGEYDPELVRLEDRDKLPTPLEVGMQFEGVPEQAAADGDSVIFVVTDIAEDKVVLDGNHPLAGIALRFELNVIEVRAASDDEIEHQHPHFDEYDEDDDDQYRSFPIQ
ncbi:MAG: FKBP-type peptidyl-prolyl cis-trans isomerase family protein [Burkholderiaceae bacterium]|nr:FKBP-type peptidyl-prolyl cis-trans isomerase family protein [Burkholderiaceae bacterium]